MVGNCVFTSLARAAPSSPGIDKFEYQSCRPKHVRCLLGDRAGPCECPSAGRDFPERPFIRRNCVLPQLRGNRHREGNDKSATRADDSDLSYREGFNE